MALRWRRCSRARPRLPAAVQRRSRAGQRAAAAGHFARRPSHRSTSMVEERLQQNPTTCIAFRPPHRPGRTRRACRGGERSASTSSTSIPNRRRSREEQLDEIREALAEIPGVVIVRRAAARAPDLAHALRREGADRHQALRRRSRRAAAHGRRDEGRHRRRARRQAT